MAVTIASNISEKSVAAIRENQPELQGIDIVEDSVRKYIDDASMGPILGYTGQFLHRLFPEEMFPYISQFPIYR